MVQAVTAGETVTLTAVKKGMSFAPSSHTVGAVANLNVPGYDFTGYVHATITGRVVDGKDAPVQYVKVTATAAAGGSSYDDTTGPTGSYSLSVPNGTYTMTAVRAGYDDVKYVNGNQTVVVAPGQRLVFGDIKATLNTDGHPPRFTSSASFRVADGDREIGTVEAVDDDDSKAEITFSITSNTGTDVMAITGDGVLSWAGVTADAQPHDRQRQQVRE